MRKREAPGHSGTDRDRKMIRDMWPTMSFSEKMQYIFYYHSVAIICVIIGIIAAIYLVHDFMKVRVEDMLYVMCVNGELDEEVTEDLEVQLADLLEIDSENQQVTVEASYNESSNYQSQATISTYMQAGRVDIVIADEESFNSYAAASYFVPLNETSLADIAAQTDIEDLFYAVPIDYSKGGAITDIPFAPHEVSDGAECYGIYLTEGLLKGYVLGIMANAPNPDNATQAAIYLLGR